MGGRGGGQEVPYVPDQDQVTQACTYLRMLLLRPGEYRSRWERPAAGTDRYEAVARVLEEAVPGRELTEVARRALEGTQLSAPGADAFVSGFGLTARHAQRPRDPLRGSPTGRVISGHTLPPPARYQPG